MLPAFLQKPPWREKKAKAQGPTATLSAPLPAPKLQWANDDEKRAFEAASGWGTSSHSDAEWKKVLAATNDVQIGEIACVKTEHVLALVPRARTRHYSDGEWFKRAVGAHGVVSAELLCFRLASDTASVLGAAMPIGDARLAPAVAVALATKKTLMGMARSWLTRHPREATAGLLGPALARQKAQRALAGVALLVLLANGHEAAVIDVAAAAGVRAEVQAVLAADPLDNTPAKAPKLPTFADASALPRPVLKDKQGALSLDRPGSSPVRRRRRRSASTPSASLATTTARASSPRSCASGRGRGATPAPSPASTSWPRSAPTSPSCT